MQHVQFCASIPILKANFKVWNIFQSRNTLGVMFSHKLFNGGDKTIFIAWLSLKCSHFSSLISFASWFYQDEHHQFSSANHRKFLMQRYDRWEIAPSSYNSQLLVSRPLSSSNKEMDLDLSWGTQIISLFRKLEKM